ncbi:MAG: hypothetical protein CMO80_21910 [Verrucomicrobiales bacterium]|nr:hypothetical protein [Verrucomicrobiales bacterium]|tara:strand:- start:963 stop:2423 length:1461 start_codon:yes stop_codon:yes gene_type:complete
MNEQKIRELFNTAKVLKSISKVYPLSVSKLWIPYCHRFDGLGDKSKRPKGCGEPMVRINHGVFHCKKCNITEKRTSQREGCLSLGREATAIIGGNRSGKSEVGAMLAVCFAAGSNAKFVQDFLSLNKLPHSLIPKKPGVVWASSLSYADGLNYIRPKLDKYLPQGTRKIFWNSQNQATAILPNGGRIVSKSADSGASKYQGASCTFIWLDEEHPEDIFAECLLRTVDTKGKILLTLTPVRGFNWINDLFVTDHLDGYSYYKLNSLDNPWISSRKIRQSVQHMSEESQRTRLFGEFTRQQGLIYPEFSKQKHIISPFKIPEDWPIFRGIDFGCRHPFVCLWVALGPDKTLYVFREYFQTEKTTVEHGHMINKLSMNDPAPEWTVADPESRDGRMILARTSNIPTRPAPKHLGVIHGINAVKNWLHFDENGKPHLFVFENCINLIREFQKYKWAKNIDSDKPHKSNDHGMDSLRYVIMQLDRYLALNS